MALDFVNTLSSRTRAWLSRVTRPDQRFWPGEELLFLGLRLGAMRSERVRAVLRSGRAETLFVQAQNTDEVRLKRDREE